MKDKSAELEAKRWLEKLTGERQTDREEILALPAYQYGDPANFIDRMREGRKRAKERVKNKGGGR